MIVTLDSQIFVHPGISQLELLGIIGMCAEGRHELLVDPSYPGTDHPVDSWLSSLPEALYGEVQFALELGPEAASQRTTKAPRIRVADVKCCRWDVKEPVLTPQVALQFLRRPLKLLVENRRNDGAFLKKLLPVSYRQTFLSAMERGWLEIESGGGLGELKVRVEDAWSRSDMSECGRMWLMFDSDSRQAGVPSKASKDLLDYCRQKVLLPWPLAAHMLERRSIENYLPLKSLQGWADRKESRGKVSGLASLKKTEQREYYNMKSGLLGDLTSEKREFYRKGDSLIADEDLPPLFRGLSAEVKRQLQIGLGTDIGDLFHDKDGVARVVEEHLQAEIPYLERMSLSQSIIDRM